MREIYHIYIENFFLLNMVFLFSSYEITSAYLRCTVTHFQILKGAALGAMGMCLILIFPIGGEKRFFIGYLLLNVMLLKYIFRSGHLKKGKLGVLPEIGMVTLIVAMLLGGAVMLLQKFLYTDSTVIMFSTTLGITFFICRVLKSMHKKEDMSLCQVMVYLGEKQWTMKGLMDTGNSLYEPISGRPVCIAERKSLEHLTELSPNSYRVIPFHSVGKDRGILPGYVFDRIVIETFQSKRIIEKPIIGISNQPLSSKNTYQMILHPKMFMEREELS